MMRLMILRCRDRRIWRCQGLDLNGGSNLEKAVGFEGSGF